MHRIQITLEDWQYQALRARAEQEGRSISDLIREAVRNTLTPSPERTSRLREMEGVGEDASTCGENHDHFLYGEKRGD